MIGDVKKNKQKEFGDYQTPLFFTDEVCSFLSSLLDKTEITVIEPNFGKGNFVNSSLKYLKNIKESVKSKL